MSGPFAGLTPGLAVQYEHGSDKTLGAVVAKVLDAETGRVNLAVLVPSGMWINIREVFPDPSIGGPPVEHAIEGFLTNRWRFLVTAAEVKPE